MKLFSLATLALFLALPAATAATPKVREKAPDFSLQSLTGGTVKLSEETAKGPVALLVLRGYPGYQCPICQRQVRDFVTHAEGFAKAGARVVMVYPGPSENLKMRAEEFVKDQTLPANFVLLLDPDYKFTNLYGLRWDAPKETAYPSTFLIDRSGNIFYSLISDSHGGRTKAEDMIQRLSGKM
jgi:peroxiredoxin